jgi:prolyl 4-hydroxylase
MQGKQLGAAWEGWLQENIARQCNPGELLAILLNHGYAIDAIQQAMGAHFPKESPLLNPTAINYQAIAEANITRANNVQKITSDKFQLYVIPDFMSAAECADIVAISQLHLRPSTITTGPAYAAYRTSSTCDLSLLNMPSVAALDEKIARMVGIQLPYSEGIQAQRYEVGQEFKQHTDYFQPNTKEYVKYAGVRGNRTWTFMVYLNEVSKGGGTRFFVLDKTIVPQLGTAIAWNNLLADGSVNPNALHAGLPVEDGHKTIITKWFRERGEGAMFYAD